VTSLPTFVIVGRVNEGKSSIVSALVEDESVPVGPEPGTTSAAKEYVIRDGSPSGTPLVRLVDTPGFQQPEAFAAMIDARLGAAPSAAAREQALRDFLAASPDSDAFRDERRLLEPILRGDGASILYVVDASHQFRPSYEFEMQILQWTGQPRFALLNETDPARTAQHAGAWSAALRQYFSVVRPFDAHRVTAKDRIGLLTTLAELDSSNRAALTAAVERLREQGVRRRDEASRLLAEGIADLVSLSVKETSGPAGLSEADRRRLQTLWQDAAVRREGTLRRQIEVLFAHKKVERAETELATPVWERDLFAKETFRLLGLSKLQLAGAAAVAGAIGGAALDAVVVGHTLFAFAGIGGALGAGASLYATRGNQDVAFAGVRVAGVEVAVGPHQDPRFAWVLLDRALLHAKAVAGRSHAQRAPLRVPEPSGGGSEGLVGKLAPAELGSFERAFRALRRGKDSPAVRDSLAKSLAAVLSRLVDAP
jgi:hypothetical protein